VEGKLYHLMVGVSVDQFKVMLDHLLTFEREIAQLSKIVSKRSGSSREEELKSEEEDGSIWLNLLAYRMLVKVNYN
jgi:hypothetical protein